MHCSVLTHEGGGRAGRGYGSRDGIELLLARHAIAVRLSTPAAAKVSGSVPSHFRVRDWAETYSFICSRSWEQAGHCCTLYRHCAYGYLGVRMHTPHLTGSPRPHAPNRPNGPRSISSASGRTLGGNGAAHSNVVGQCVEVSGQVRGCCNRGTVATIKIRITEQHQPPDLEHQVHPSQSAACPPVSTAPAPASSPTPPGVIMR